VHLDSILVGPHETWEGAFLADNPGLWMLHCHVLVHAHFGLSTMVGYEGIRTPYSIGSDSGNNPE
jgi:FtsP/CotA-like multicopper oxidase with cupredoxin domain